MALHNEILVGRFNRFFQRVFGMKGRVPAPQLSSEVQMVHPIFHGAENRWSESWRRFAAPFSVGPTAAQIEGAQISNPAGSNVIAVIEKIQLFSNTAQNVDVSENFASQAALVNAGAPAALDPRQGAITGSAIKLSTSAGGTTDLAVRLYTVLMAVNVGVELILTHNQEIVLLPTQTIKIVETTVNTLLVGNIIWRERGLEEGETS